MRRLLFIIALWLLGQTVAAQPSVQLQYWVDHDFASRTVRNSASGTWQLEVDMATLHRGFHTLYLQVRDTSSRWQAPEAHLFYHADFDTTNLSLMEYWFDGNYATHQSGTVQGVHLLDVAALRDGFHTFSLRLGNGLNTQLQQSLFYKAHPADTSRSYEYWFDNQYATAQQGNIGTGGVMEFEVSSLHDGFHTLYLRLGNGFGSELRSALFYKAPVPSAADSMVTYWFDGVDSTMTTQPIGNGLVLLNVEELTDTTHTVYLILGNSRMAQLQSHEFQKVPVVYTVMLATADSTMGSVNGGGDYPRNSTVSIAAMAEYGFHFTTWSDGDTHALRSIYLTQDTSLTAYFAPDTFSVDITQCDSTMGTVIVYGNGSYLSDDTVTAVSNYGYHFTSWSDGDTTNPRIVTLTQDTVLTALFVPNIYTVTLTSATPEWGSVLGGGEYEYLTVVPLEAVAVYGYQFKRWNDGNTDNPRNLVVRGDTTLTAEFELRRYTLTVNSNDLSLGFTQGGGTFSVLDTATALAITLAGNSFLGWNDGATDNPRQMQIWCDTVVTALFEVIAETIDTVTIHDTSYFIVTDTIINTVYDTITDTVYDTITNTVYDTITNTVFDTITNTVFDTITNTVFDTITNTVFDTITNTIHDTITNTIHDTIDNYIYDTMLVYDTTIVTDTLWLSGDTVYITLYDTVYIHDTVYVGVDDVEMTTVKLYQRDGCIVVEGSEGQDVWVFDAVGRTSYSSTSATRRSPSLASGEELRIPVPATGTYLVKIGDYPARRIVVIR